ncbi:hypothetical protein [Capnocytophaga sp. HP1101]
MNEQNFPLFSHTLLSLAISKGGIVVAQKMNDERMNGEGKVKIK